MPIAEIDMNKVEDTIKCLHNWCFDQKHVIGVIPRHMLEATAKYILYGYPPERGDFLEAIIDDRPWSDICAVADEWNMRALKLWHLLLVNVFPSEAWRSAENRAAWCGAGGTGGVVPPYLASYRDREEVK